MAILWENANLGHSRPSDLLRNARGDPQWILFAGPHDIGNIATEGEEYTIKVGNSDSSVTCPIGGFKYFVEILYAESQDVTYVDSSCNKPIQYCGLGLCEGDCDCDVDCQVRML